MAFDGAPGNLAGLSAPDLGFLVARRHHAVYS